MALPQIKDSEPVDSSADDKLRDHAGACGRTFSTSRWDAEKAISTRCPTEPSEIYSGEAAKLIGVDDSYLRQLALEGKGPRVEVLPTAAVYIPFKTLIEIRDYLDRNGKGGRNMLNTALVNEHLQVISCVNFKGGSAKTTTSAHLAQYLALNGYRILAVDLDPQASLDRLTWPPA